MIDRLVMRLGPWTPVFFLGVVLWVGVDAIRHGHAGDAFVQGVIAGIVIAALLTSSLTRRRRRR